MRIKKIFKGLILKLGSIRHLDKYKNYLVSTALITALILYKYNAVICDLVYPEDLKNPELANVNFWNMRFANYSLIIMLVSWCYRVNISRFNKMILSIISQLAFISVYDKFILNSYDLENYDNLIIFTVIFFTLLRYKTHVNSKTS